MTYLHWNFSYQNFTKPGVVHRSEKSVSLKLCINKLKIALQYWQLFNYLNRTVTSLQSFNFNEFANGLRETCLKIIAARKNHGLNKPLNTIS